MPLRRMKAMTTSMASADSISERSWLHRPGSPGALVSSVVSSSGVIGCSIGLGEPSGLRCWMAWRTCAGSAGVSCGSVLTSSPRVVSSWRAT